MSPLGECHRKFSGGPSAQGRPGESIHGSAASFARFAAERAAGVVDGLTDLRPQLASRLTRFWFCLMAQAELEVGLRQDTAQAFALTLGAQCQMHPVSSLELEHLQRHHEDTTTCRIVKTPVEHPDWLLAYGWRYAWHQTQS